MGTHLSADTSPIQWSHYQRQQLSLERALFNWDLYFLLFYLNSHNVKTEITNLWYLYLPVVLLHTFNLIAYGPYCKLVECGVEKGPAKFKVDSFVVLCFAKYSQFWSYQNDQN